ncbi:helix-turn-helix transcriptional regulator [Actinomadura flavalba]|uniref:helix-turn-helix transcriptional regulator n=1 Tax=Actinomadura flavalba TaxID=1120938 RepID=UPI000378F16E|nr:AraC family transcriptional regulator [Actinomadura flavalba]
MAELRDLGPGENARHWRHPAVADVDLLRARFVTYRFGRHVHEGYTVGVIESGVEEFAHPGGVDRAGPGALAVVNPDVVHTGHAGTPEGWTYRVLYPGERLVREVAAELGRRGAPSFGHPVIWDPEAAALLRAAHRAGEDGSDALTGSTLLRRGLAALLRHAGADLPDGAALPADVARARDILHARLVDPPTLEELAAASGTRPFPLLRAFRTTLGLPPHAYLNQVRVRAARRLLDEGHTPAATAAATGFADQAHLTRHFKKAVGVPPGAYRRTRHPG